MAGQHIYLFEYKSPGNIGWLANDFGVHQVGKANETSSDRGGYGYHIQYVHVVHLGFAAI